MKIALAQLNLVVGDIRGNTARIIESLTEARKQGADLLVTSELAVIGYPPRDLLLKSEAIEACAQAVQAIAEAAVGISVLVGYPEKNTTSVGRALFNSAALVRDGKIVSRCHKALLPTYDVFDESRYFEPGSAVALANCAGQVIGVTICEDLWNDELLLDRQLYHVNPVAQLAAAGAEIIVNLSASPFVSGKNDFRQKLFGHQAQRHRVGLVYVNQVGGQDELIFDGNSAVYDAQGQIMAQAKDFAEDLLVVDLAGRAEPAAASPAALAPRTGIAAIYAALIMGLQDYMRKCGFKSVVLGLSGGIDSAVVGALAAEALGADKVLGVALPSRYSSDHSRSDAALLAENLGIAFHTVEIEAVHEAFGQTLEPLFAGTGSGLAEENLQARIRGNLLMALSNKFGHLLLTTGNKSEVATGYCTLYGDMCGGLSVISDVPKMMVYELARYINAQAAAAGKVYKTGEGPIPIGSITKPPSAELRPNQKDQDSLPPYEILDAILLRYVEQEMSVAAIVAEGFEEATVKRVVGLVDRNEYKRKQMAPGLKVTSRAFGVGRRMPIAQRYRC